MNDPFGPSDGAADDHRGADHQAADHQAADHQADAPWPSDEACAAVPVAADFVERTLAAVRADRQRIAAEAAMLDQLPRDAELLDRALLDAFEVTAPAPGFVDATLAAVHADRLERATLDAQVRALLDRYDVPSSSPDFVSRTLAALRVDRSPLHLVAEPESTPAPTPRARPAGWRLVAAAAVLLGLALWRPWQQGADAPTAPRTEIALGAALDFSPTPVATAWARAVERTPDTLRFEPDDALLLLAAAELPHGGNR
ncbi:MAG: hypothetical protein IPM29_13250 [Planctomycetes bacterium]|nr:hypothetical protein [Planctomycetota bacterium]